MTLHLDAAIEAGSRSLRVPGYRWLLAAVLSLLAATILAVTAPWGQIASAASPMVREPLPVLVTAVAYSAAFSLRAVAWRLLLSTPVPLGALFRNLQFGLVANHLLPLKAGEVTRPLLAIRRGVPPAEAVATSVVARLLDLVSLAMLALALLRIARMSGTWSFAAPTAAAGTLGCAVALFLLRRGAPGWLPAALGTRIEAATGALRQIPLARVALAAPIAALSWILEAAVLVYAAELLGVDLSLRAAVGVTAFTILFQIAHVTPGGIGVYEAAMTAALVSQGVAAEDALALAVLTHALKFAYAFTFGAAFAGWEGVFILRGERGRAPKAASRVEVLAARAWNVLNEGKPFTPVFAATIAIAIVLLGIADGASWTRGALASVLLVPLALVFWRFDFPMRLRAALWVYLGAYAALTWPTPIAAVALTVALYLVFTVILWGTVYYHLRIGTPWSNGFRFIRLVAENEDPTSGNLLEQLPKVLLLVLMFEELAGGGTASSAALVVTSTVVIAVSAVLLHQWFFTWVPPVARPRLSRALAAEGLPPLPPVPPRRARRVIAIVIDGCRADRLEEARTPCLDALRASGVEFRAMTTVYPARTVTGFSSMLTGAAPEAHGMRSNFVPSLGVKCESVFDVLRGEGMAGRLVGIAHLIDAFGEDVRSVTAVMHNDAIDDALVAQAQRVLIEDDPELLVLQLLSVDQTGHARGSYNAEYLAKLEETDRKIEAFLAWCRERGYLDGASIVVTADHGQGIGIGGHGHMSPTEARIPCIVAGAGVPTTGPVAAPRSIVDIAPTITDLLGLRPPAASVGRSLIEGAGPQGPRPVVFVIPAHNEGRNLPTVLDAVALSGVPHSRVLVVDDGSTDDTAAVARARGAAIVSHPARRGLGAAVRTGLAAAREFEPRAVVYLDADREYDAREAARLLAPIEAGEADYVLGNRFAHRPEGMTRPRRIANRAFSALLSLCCGRWIADGQTGFRAFSPRAVQVAEIVHDYNYAQVLTLDLLRKGMRLREVGISYRRRTQGRSFVRAEYLWRVPLGMAREMLRG